MESIRLHASDLRQIQKGAYAEHDGPDDFLNDMDVCPDCWQAWMITLYQEVIDAGLEAEDTLPIAAFATGVRVGQLRERERKHDPTLPTDWHPESKREDGTCDQ